MNKSQQESAAYILVSNGNGRIVNDFDLWPRCCVHAGSSALSGEWHRAVVMLIWRRWWRLWWPHARRIGHCTQIVSVVGLYGRLLCAHRRLIERCGHWRRHWCCRRWSRLYRSLMLFILCIHLITTLKN